MRTLEEMRTLRMSNFPANVNKEKVEEWMKEFFKGSNKQKKNDFSDVVNDVWDNWVVTFETKEQTKTARKMAMKKVLQRERDSDNWTVIANPKEETKTGDRRTRDRKTQEETEKRVISCEIDTISATQCIPGFRSSHVCGILAGLLPPPSSLLPPFFFPSLLFPRSDLRPLFSLFHAL
jgi:hypothetical protein